MNDPDRVVQIGMIAFPRPSAGAGRNGPSGRIQNAVRPEGPLPSAQADEGLGKVVRGRSWPCKGHSSIAAVRVRQSWDWFPIARRADIVLGTPSEPVSSPSRFLKPQASLSVVDSSSSALITGVRHRQPEAWARLARLYAPAVYSWARQAGLQESDAADVVQQVFHAALMSIDTFDRRQGALRTWLWGITRNKLRHHFREWSARPAAAGGTDMQAAIEQIPDVPFEESSGRIDASSTLMQRAIALVRPDLQEDTWHAFWQLVVEGEPTADVARQLGMTSQAVRQARYRVLKRLRDELEGEL